MKNGNVFDSFNLLAKLDKQGLLCSFLEWLKSYVGNRSCDIKIDMHISKKIVSSSLYIIHQQCHSRFSSRYCSFVCWRRKHFAPIHNTRDYMLLPDCLDTFCSWCKRSGLTIYIEKCFCVSFCRCNSYSNSFLLHRRRCS